MRNAFYSEELNRMYEGLNLDEYIVGTYLVGAEHDEDPIIKAASIAIEQTTGSWVDIPEETPEVREKYAAKTIGVYEVPDFENVTNLKDIDTRWYVMRIAYPVAIFEDNMPLMMASVMGNIAALPNLKLIDMEFGREFTKTFQGPKFGTDGIRKLLNVYDRPLLNNMIKPCTGYTPEVGAKLFYEAAVGGVDIIKDDELISGNRAFNKLEDRVRLNMEAVERAKKEKNEDTLYCCNITDEVSKLKENAMTVINNGGNCIMVDVVSTGLSALRALAEDPEITVPILAHACGGGAMFTSQFQGMSSHVLNKMIRLCGADIVVNSSPYGKFDILHSKYMAITKALTGKFYDIKPSIPLYGGGIIPAVVKKTLTDAGIDCVLGVGAGIHAHPMGPRAGAVAMRQAIDAVMEGKVLSDVAKEKPELKAAIEVWGDADDDLSKNYLI
ncbi:MAG: RuBisCO large subunit C-terminal-like domain-containing protein [Eubacteriaceae bacterium]|nr:RuBisCO large subunit C-terminal-like domain-containing protein [Eubacteriaceae bacterium]